ncbi:MAG: DNA polymerase III subunit alpha [Treponema sp.]|nr:DNA polymerase III subunit alpha [Treponema sp.]
METRLGLISAYSFLYGVHKPQALLDKAASFGVKTVSICDINGLYGLHSFLEAAEERNIRPVIGTVLTFERDLISGSAAYAPLSLYLFAENRAGFSRICEILSLRNKDTKKFNPLDLLRDNSEGLVVVSHNSAVLKELALIASAGKIKHLYAAISAGDLSCLGVHKELNLPLAFLDTSAFLDASDYQVHKTLRAIGLNKTTGNLCASELYPNLADVSQAAGTFNSVNAAGSAKISVGKGFFKTSTELSSLLESWPEAARGTSEIAELCQFHKIHDGFIFPSYGENPADELRRRVYSGASERYGELGDMETDRVEYELEVIEKMGFAPYFLHMDDIVAMTSRTCGRGSGAASIVSYALGITNVDPIAHDLYFERFLNPARPDPPDIDVDFAWDERDEIIKSVIKNSGDEYCARVANHNFFRHRSALRETAKAYGFTDAAISKLERKIFDLREKEENIDPLWAEIYKIAARIEGLPRGLSMHCGGLVITPQPINRYAPIEKSLEGFPLLAWEKEGTKSAGFVKIDLLGNRSLAVIRDAVKNICENACEPADRGRGAGIVIKQLANGESMADNEKYKNKESELNEILSRAIHDAATINALSRGDSIGVFYIESPAMRQLQKKTKAGDFDHIVIHSSIIRPAANKFICEYVKRLRGEKWKPLHPRLDKILNETYGILCYQEDVSKTAVALADFDDVTADKLRKVIAKKAGAEKLKVYEKQFFEGCEKNNVDENTIREIWAMMLSFDGYSFCKPHSASYAMVSFQSACLRVHYPAEFMAAVLSNQGGFYRPHAYIAEIRRMGLTTEGPDVNISDWRYYGITGEEYIKISDGTKIKKRGVVIIGLMAIKGLSASGARRIFDEREERGLFKNLDDFSKRVRISRDDIIALCPAGVFDSISAGQSRIMQARYLLSKLAAAPDKKQNELFLSPVSCSLFTAHQSSPNADYAALEEEYMALGFLRGAHPLVLWKDKVLSVKKRVKAANIGNYLNRYVQLIGWPVTQKDVWTKDGLTMSFLSMEDETAMYETVVFPDVYDRYNKLLFDQQPLIISGWVKDDQGAVIMEVRKIEELCPASVKQSCSIASIVEQVQ